MATTYRMTWRKEGRWRKKYRGKSYYIAAPEGKLASYQRCWELWLRKKSEIDNQLYESDTDRRAWRSQINRMGHKLAEIAAVDTSENRRSWEFWHAQREAYRFMMERDDPFPFISAAQEADPESVPFPLLVGIDPSDEPPQPPPWERRPRTVEDSKTLAANVQRFLRRKAQQVERGQLSHGRYDTIRVALDAFVGRVGGHVELAAVSGPELAAFRDWLELRIDRQEISPHSARDRLQGVSQFVRWAWGEELMTLPRILESSEFSITLPETKIQTFTDDEVGRLLGAASDSTKLYLLLMLNCGVQQSDIAELRQNEVDWGHGRIKRQRSKTRKRNGDSVPTVDYLLWPETFSLLKKFRSRRKELVLTNAKGGPLKVEVIVNGRVKKTDNIRSAYRRVVAKMANAKTDPVNIDKPLKLLRKTAATKLGSHPEYSKFAQHFLGHAPGSVADRHYVSPSAEQFDKAVAWLGEQFIGTQEDRT